MLYNPYFGLAFLVMLMFLVHYNMILLENGRVLYLKGRHLRSASKGKEILKLSYKLLGLLKSVHCCKDA